MRKEKDRQPTSFKLEIKDLQLEVGSPPRAIAISAAILILLLIYDHPEVVKLISWIFSP